VGDDGANYLHLGAGIRYVGADGNVLRYKGYPASNVTDPYVDTSNMTSNHAWNTSLEVLWNQGPYSLLAEYVTSSVSSATSGDPNFYGYYVTGSWIITGEHRPYDKTAAYARRIQPVGRWGAWKLMARYGRVNLDDAAVHGGAMYGGWAAVNWWATRRWRFTVQYGDVDLERYGIIGNTRELLSRMRWIF
jgi:phosphate-selective porin OprO and OprP